MREFGFVQPVPVRRDIAWSSARPVNKWMTDLWDADVLVASCVRQFFRRERVFDYGRDVRPVMADGAALIALAAEADGFERDKRNPDRREQVPVLAPDDPVEAAQKVGEHLTTLRTCLP